MPDLSALVGGLFSVSVKRVIYKFLKYVVLFKQFLQFFGKVRRRKPV